MRAVNSSTLIAYIQGDGGQDVDALDAAFAVGEISLPPLVLTEVLSDPKLPATHRMLIQGWPVLDVMPDYWLRAGASRSAVLARGLRARLPDTLIAQSCIDHDVELITRDGDFRHFVTHCGLRLA